jgi:hypothetical protein
MKIQEVLKDSIIEVDSDEGKELGFTSDKFMGWLWKVDNSIYISFIQCINQNKGNFSELLDNIESKGYVIKVPNPLKKMKQILIKKGFQLKHEWWSDANAWVDVYIKAKGTKGE